MTASQMQIINVTENEAEINKELSQLDPILVFTNENGFAVPWALYCIVFYFILYFILPHQKYPILQVVTAF